jgi:hypothetical protein
MYFYYSYLFLLYISVLFYKCFTNFLKRKNNFDSDSDSDTKKGKNLNRYTTLLILIFVKHL